MEIYKSYRIKCDKEKDKIMENKTKKFTDKQKVKGITLFLYKKGVKGREKQIEYMEDYGVENELQGFENICLHAQANFKSFYRWSVKKGFKQD